MDLLSRSLSSIKVSATSVSTWRLAAPWGVDVVSFQPGYCLFVAGGDAWLSHDTDGNRHLTPGQIVFAPLGADCRIMSAPSALCTDIHALPWVGTRFSDLTPISQPIAPVELEMTGDGERTLDYGLAFSLDGAARDVVLPKLPNLTVFERPSSGIVALFQAMVEELVSQATSGYVAIANQLAHLIVTALLRELLAAQGGEAEPWTRAMGDRRLLELVTAIHEAPGEAWSLSRMANYAHMSRPTLCRRFADMMGETPIDYVTETRLKAACKMLAISDAPLATIAADAGFGSDRAFRRAFQHRRNMTPTAYRKLVRRDTTG